MNNHITTNTYCRSCKQMILWTTNHTTGAKMPVNVQYQPTGNITVYHQQNGKHISLVGGIEARIAAGIVDKVWYTTTSHFATCEYAHKYRKAKKC